MILLAKWNNFSPIYIDFPEIKTDFPFLSNFWGEVVCGRYHLTRFLPENLLSADALLIEHEVVPFANLAGQHPVDDMGCHFSHYQYLTTYKKPHLAAHR